MNEGRVVALQEMTRLRDDELGGEKRLTQGPYPGQAPRMVNIALEKKRDQRTRVHQVAHDGGVQAHSRVERSVGASGGSFTGGMAFRNASQSVAPDVSTRSSR